MPSPTITNIDLGELALHGDEYRDDTLRFDAADSFVKGTILARRAVVQTPVAAADGGNTGNGTVTALSIVEGPVVPLPGAYVLRCTAAVTHGGVFRLEDPNGAIVATGLEMTAGAGVATVFEVAGLRFTVTDAATDFVAGDFFTITVTADGKLVVFAKAGSRGDQVPVAVLAHAITKGGAGTEPVRVLVAGTVNKKRLVIDADGDDSNVDAAVMDQLREVGIVPIDVQQTAVLDNQ